jgi:hypothetical protein
MPRGGYRPGAGRPKGSGKATTSAKVPAEVKREARGARLTPLDYMLAVMNDDDVDPMRRDRMAIAAAPFVHAKPGDAPQGKKAAAEEAAQTAGQGSEWGDDLVGPPN